jgi:hypothetical protein
MFSPDRAAPLLIDVHGLRKEEFAQVLGNDELIDGS